MKRKQAFLVLSGVFLLLALANPAAAAEGDTSSASITSFSQTNPADGIDFWPDGFNYTVTNTKMYENFAGLGAWVSFNLGTGESKGTSGDYGYIRCKAIGADDWSGMYTNRPSFTAASLGNTYFVIRYKGNTTGHALWRVHGFTSDSMAGTGWVIATLTQTTSWTTYRTALPTTNALESISLEVEITTGQPNVEIDYDFLLLTPSNLDGWQHDCSGTGNISLEAGTSISSDGDKVTVTGTYPTASKTFWFVDNTVTHAGLTPSYYPFLEIVISSVSNNPTISLWVQLSGGSETYVGAITSAAGTYRYYLPAVSSLAVTWLVIYANRASSGVSSYTVDQVSIYAIANFTTTVTGGAIGDVAYISSNALVVDKSSGTLFQFDRDSAISVAQGTYQVWNITTNTKTAVGISLYVSGWSTTDDETRGAMPTGTTTDMRIRTDADCTISGVRFITDSTKPDVARSSVAPVTPDMTSTVTLSAVATDTLEVYKVYFDAIVSPTGFTDTNYYATEQTENLWTYTFGTILPEGYYCFKVVVSDGANTNDLDYYSYIEFTVGRRSQTVFIRIFDSLGDFVPFETFEVYRNGTRQYTDAFSCYTDEAWQISVKDRFGATLNTTTFADGTEELVVIVNIHSLKVQSWHHDYVFFNLTRSGITYREVIAPLEIVNFRLYQNTYTWLVDYRNGTTVSGSTTLTSSTAIVVTGSTIADIAGYSQTLIAMSTSINVTVTSTNNQVLTISIDLTNVNSTIHTQLIQLLLNVTNTNSTLYSQTVDLLAAIQNANSTLFGQTVTILADIQNTNSTLYAQTLSILANIANTNATLYSQTLTILTDLSNVNSTLYSQTVTLLANIANLDSDIAAQTVTLLAEIQNVNSTLYSQTVTLLADIANVNATLYSQTVTLLADVTNVNATLYNQTLTLLANLANVNSTLYSQSITLLANVQNVNSTLYAQTLTILTQIQNANMTLYNQTVSILTYILNTNSTLYAQTITLLTEVDTIEEQAEVIEDVARQIYGDLPPAPEPTKTTTENIWALILKLLVGGVIILILAIILATVIRALLNDRRLKAPGGNEANAKTQPTVFLE